MVVPKSLMVLKKNEPISIKEFSEEAEITYPTALAHTKDFAERGWVTTRKAGKERCIWLTDKGARIQKRVKNVNEFIEEESKWV